MSNELVLAYQQQGCDVINLGGIVLDQRLLPEARVHLSLKQLNRHGLVAGATGSGKTKTLQALAEQLSAHGVPSLVMDIKGDLSGLSMPGESTAKLVERARSMGLEFEPCGFPVELFSLSEATAGIPLRSSIHGFGALLFSRILELNEVQTGVVTILFEYAKFKSWDMIELADVEALIRFCQTEAGRQEVEQKYGHVSISSLGSIMRRLIELRAQGADFFFAAPGFELHDLFRTNAQGQGVISILRLMDMQTKPLLFSTVILKLILDVYQQLPEVGDLSQPKLMIFIDEAHLLFSHANKPLLNLLDTMVKLIRSKGVGLVFCTQTPEDIPDNILGQLGFKIQHALRAFTAKDRQAIHLAAKNFPESKFYSTEDLLTSLPIGEALVTAIDDKGAPSPLVQCKIRAPQSRMGTLSATEEEQVLNQSTLYAKYKTRITRPCPLGETSVLVAEKPIKLNWIEVLSKNVLVRQILRDLFKKLGQVIIQALKK